MDELDFELLHAKVLGAESRREMLQGNPSNEGICMCLRDRMASAHFLGTGLTQEKGATVLNPNHRQY